MTDPEFGGAQRHDWVEVETRDAVEILLTERRSFARVAIRGVDLEGVSLSGIDLRGALLLGCELDPDAQARAVAAGALVFPELADLPISAYRGSLYRPEELYAGIRSRGYGETPDAKSYRWMRSTQGDVFAELVRHLHDLAMEDAVAELHDGTQRRPSVVSIMGSHRLARTSPAYAEVARLAMLVARRGHIVATGGGPGAMEAANLGATVGGSETWRDGPEAERGVRAVVASIGAHPNCGSTDDDISFWAVAGLTAAERYVHGRLRSIGVPTWFYGHEPPNPFAQLHAKYFANALREDRLLRLASEAIIVTDGRAGTVQEIFQAAVLIHYGDPHQPRPRLILVGSSIWEDSIPAMPLLRSLANEVRDGQWGHLLRVVETSEEAVEDLAQQ